MSIVNRNRLRLSSDVWVLGRVAVVALLEFVLLGDWLSAYRFAQRSDLIAQIILSLPGIATLLLTMIGGCSLAFAVSGQHDGTLGWKPFALSRLVIHLIAFAASLLLGRVVFAIDQSPRTEWVVAWFATLFVSGLTLLWWAADLRDWVRFVVAERRPLSGGAALGLAAWTVAVSTPQWWEQLAPYTLHSVHGLLRTVYDEPLCDVARQVIGTTQFQVVVAPGCSGLDGMALVTTYVAAALILFRHRLRFPQALVMIPLACLLSWLLNSVRIALLVVIGSEWSRDVAVAGFHSESGWVFFNLTALVAVFVMLKSPWLLADRTAIPTIHREADLFLAPFIVLSMTQLIALALSDGWQRSPWFPTLTTAVVLLLLIGKRPSPSVDWPSGAMIATAMAVSVGLFGLWIGLVGDDPAASQTLKERVQALSPFEQFVWIGARCIGSVIVVPIVEELAFRGYLMRRFQGDPFDRVAYRECRWPGVGLSSIAFGLLHPDWMAGIAAGAVFGTLTVYTGRLGPAILAHAVTNLLIAVLVLGAGRWDLWA